MSGAFDSLSAASWGKGHRTLRLQGSNGYNLFLALDHGASLGPISGVGDIAGAMEAATASSMSGVVLNPHWLKRQPTSATVPIIAQMMSLPASGLTRYSQKVLYGTIDLAIRVDASAIAVQLRLDDASLSAAVSQIAAIVESADSIGLPVLFMMNLGPDGWLDSNQPAFAVRVAGEMGADYVKIPAPPAMSETEQDAFITVIKHSPRVLLAGGPRNHKFYDAVERCAGLGFAGVCVGRNVFEAQSPVAVVERIRTIFSLNRDRVRD